MAFAITLDGARLGAETFKSRPLCRTCLGSDAETSARHERVLALVLGGITGIGLGALVAVAVRGTR
jgi:hypothetical protein